MPHRLLTQTLLLFLITTFVFVEQSGVNASNGLNSQRPRRGFASSSKPGFFKTLFSVIYEQYSDTKTTINKVNTLINDNFLPENGAIVVTEAPTSSDPNITTTAAPYRITRTEFNKIIRRNLKGLVRLFNIELQDALGQSDRNYAQYKKNASLEVSKFL